MPVGVLQGGRGSATHNGWGSSIREDANVWYQSAPELGMLIMLGGHGGSAPPEHSFSAANFSTYRAFTANGAHSMVANPMLRGLLPAMNASNVQLSGKTDMRPVATSPVIGRGQPTIWTQDFGGDPVPRSASWTAWV